MTPDQLRFLRGRELKEYLGFARDQKFLDVDEERRLILAAQSGDPEAMSSLVVSNMRYVARMASKFCSAPLRRLPLVDACQEGALGLMKAVREFDLDAKVKLKTYATYWILKSLKLANADYLLIRVPAHHLEPGRSSEVGEEARIRSDLALKCRDATAASGDGDRPLSWEELFGGRESDHVLDEVDRVEEERAKVGAWLGRLDRKKGGVLRERFGFDGKEPRTLKMIGASLGISGERVRQLQSQAMEELAGFAAEGPQVVTRV